MNGAARPRRRLDQLTLGMMRLAYVIYGALLAGMVAIVIVIAHMRWREEWWLAPLLALLLIWGLMVWRCMRQSADGRLWLDEQTLRVETGLPRQAAWLGLSTSWSVSLDDLRSGKAQWRWNEVILKRGAIFGANSLRYLSTFLFALCAKELHLRQKQPA